jgi:hypothetical protein
MTSLFAEPSGHYPEQGRGERQRITANEATRRPCGKAMVRCAGDSPADTISDPYP